ncbi:MAG: hypothetical protein PHI34_02595 [Acidobacteriota bacterium]|nr:hypothetical protein [Acidobacteriota bacterium]
MRTGRFLAAVLAASFAAAGAIGPAVPQDRASAPPAPAPSALLPKAGQAGEWAAAAEPARYVRESLYGYIDGGAELILPYGFEELAVGRYGRAGGREVTIEIYKTATALDAFGLFSVQRDGREDISSAIASPHWLSPSQACLVKGRYHVNLVGYETRADDLEGMLRTVEALLPSPGRGGPDPRFGALPAEGRVPRSERYIKGEAAARAETQFFSDEAWGFGRGATAVSARYEPGGIKMIIVEAASEPAGLEAAVRAQFAANLEAVEAESGRLTARGGSGQTFFYQRLGRTAYLIWGKDAAAASALLGRTAR